jgi:hypothetical protein
MQKFVSCRTRYTRVPRSLFTRIPTCAILPVAHTYKSNKEPGDLDLVVVPTAQIRVGCDLYDPLLTDFDVPQPDDQLDADGLCLTWQLLYHNTSVHHMHSLNDGNMYIFTYIYRFQHFTTKL